MTRCVLPWKLYSESCPAGPSFRYAWFGTGTPGRGFIVAASGRSDPAGHAVTYDGAELSTAVTFITAAVAAAGIGSLFASVTDRPSFGPTAPALAPVPS